MALRTGVSIPPFTDVEMLLTMATEAEQAGWDGVFIWDHMQWDLNPRLDVHDPWVLLGAIAERTERVRLGTLVTPLARRRPWVVAKHVTTLDHLSGGRAVLGVGLGAPADADFASFGDASSDRERAEVLDDALAVLDSLLRGPIVHHGPRFDVEAELRPQPVQKPRPPIWVAAIAPHRRPLARAVRWDGVVPLGEPGFLMPDELAAYLGSIERPPGWDVVASWAPEATKEDYEAVGVTWLFDSTWPEGDWVPEFRARIRQGPND